ncbi:MAG: hypothetical protein NT118_12995 [Lentisphaerae bacterium]|nr:hypothetical protein [Lentisphaerota bacterium]
MKKEITVMVAESGQKHVLEIDPDTTVREILREMRLPAVYQIAKPKEGFFAENEIVYEDVPDGVQLVASTPVEVGVGFISAVLNFLAGGLDAPPAASPPHRRLMGTPSAVHHRSKIKHCGISPAGHVARKNELLYWQKKRWTKTDITIYEGNFSGGGYTLKGRAEQSPSGRLDLFMFNPPEKLLRKHPHGKCFWFKKDGWYFIHSNNEKYFDLSSAIIQIEKLLEEVTEL